jgi:hypothetical protein
VPLIAFGSDKGSPGATTAALILAAVWPRRTVLAELDPAGGDLPMRLTDAAGNPRLAAAPSLLTLATSTRRDVGAEEVWRHCQPTPPGLNVLPGLLSAEQGAGLAGLWPGIARALSDVADADVLADVGRLLPGSRGLEVASHADRVVVVGRGSVEGLVHLRERVSHLLPAFGTGLDRRPGRVAVLMVADERDGDAAVRAARTVLDHAGLPVAVLGFLPLEPRTVVAVQRGELTARLCRTILQRRARAVAEHLVADLPALATGAVRSDPTEAPRSVTGVPAPARYAGPATSTR